MNPLTLEEIEQRISGIYRWFAREAPDVKPNPDAGELGLLWSLFDDYVMEGSNAPGEDLQ